MTKDADLKELLLRASQADGWTRIEYRDRIAAHGEAAIDPMTEWLTDRRLAAFAIQVLGAIGDHGAAQPVVEVLRRASAQLSAPLRRDADAVLTRLGAQRHSNGKGAPSTAGPARARAPRIGDQKELPGLVDSQRQRGDDPVRDHATGQADIAISGTPVRIKRFMGEAPRLRARITKPTGEREPFEWYVLDTLSRDLRRIARIDRLISLEAVRGNLTPHAFQLETALRVLRDGRRAAILADEVGLGKTIEAGLVIKELILRGDAKRILIIVPKALVAQWQQELRDKFGEDFATTDDDPSAHRSFDRVITTLGKFQRSIHEFVDREWDVVLFDEAHLLANPKSKRRQAAGEVPRRWLLLLTATPLSNKITDLWSLVDLVSPGRLGTVNQFTATYAADASMRRVHPHLTPELRLISRESMSRTRRSESGVPFSTRHVETRKIKAAPREDELYERVTDYLVRTYRRNVESRSANRGTLIREAISLQQSLSSGPQALALALDNRARSRPEDRPELEALATAARGMRGSKERLLMKVLGEAGDQPAVIFTLRIETLNRLVDVLTAEGHDARPYHGQLSGTQRSTAVLDFTRGSARFLVATDAGAEGLNLHQRCNLVVNYDLHWNPMKLEQRIGRVHRFGQERPVTVFNLAVRDTVDDYVLEVLTQKLNLFTSVIGEVEDVLAEIEEGEGDLEELIMEIVLRAKDRTDLRRLMAELESNLVEAKRRAVAAKEFTAGVLG
jgi:SNF2 family DNA or RNA helicase